MTNWTEELVSVMARLRAEDGCPWDREQTHDTLKPFLIEEAYELIDAIDDADDELLSDELGDVLLQVVFHCQIAAEEDRFTLDDVARQLTEKLIRRHPHVFGNTEVEDADGVVKQWEDIKKTEKTGSSRESILDGVPRHFPALSRAQKLQKKAAKVGFEWEDIPGVLDKLEEEICELREAVASGDHGHTREEIGDVLFSVVNLARYLKVDSEQALTETSHKFYRRFRQVEQRVAESGKEFEAFTLQELDAFWDAAKAAERAPGN